MIHNLEKNTADTYIYRIYVEPFTLRYAFAMPVSYRPETDPLAWEAHAWNSVKLLLPAVPMVAFCDTMLWISDWLMVIEDRFKYLIGTFEISRLKAYRRLFRNKFVLEVVGYVKKTYNRVTGWFAIVWFRYSGNYKLYKDMWE